MQTHRYNKLMNQLTIKNRNTDMLNCVRTTRFFVSKMTRFEIFLDTVYNL